MVIPPSKEELLKKAHDDVREIEEQYKNGLITDGERYNKVVDIWAEVTDRIADEMLRDLGSEKVTDDQGHEISVPSFNPIFMMADSGARGSAQQIRQLAGMRGLMAKPSAKSSRRRLRRTSAKALRCCSTSSPPTARARVSRTPL